MAKVNVVVTQKNFLGDEGRELTVTDLQAKHLVKKGVVKLKKSEPKEEKKPTKKAKAKG